MDLNDSEARLVDDIVRLIDMASRVLNAPAGSHYMWDKSHQLAIDAKRLADRLGGSSYQRLPDPIDSQRVQAAVAREAQHYALGKAMYGTRAR